MARPRGHRPGRDSRTTFRSWTPKPIVLPSRTRKPYLDFSKPSVLFKTSRNVMRSDIPFKGKLTLKSQRQKVFRAMNPFHQDVICAKRKIRKEVLHALGFAHRGAGAGKPKHWTRSSKVRC